MPAKQRFYYYVSDNPDAISPGSDWWNRSLPASRHDRLGSGDLSPHDSLTYGQYFEAVSTFLMSHERDILPQAISYLAPHPYDVNDISRIDIHLEKHGAFYHPARVVLKLGDKQIPLVVNVAFSEQGRIVMDREYENLGRLVDMYTPSWLPRVFGIDRHCIDNHKIVTIMLGEWLDGFQEFHVTQAADSNAKVIQVWDPDNEHVFLNNQQARSVYEQVAMILTAYYCLDTFEGIGSWHHAAGDFVVRLRDGGLQVRLITVRSYEPLFHQPHADHDLESLLNALLIFLLHMSIRLRLDRLDGVGEMTWIGTEFANGIIPGFFKGLAYQVQAKRIPVDLVDAFKIFILALPKEEIRDLVQSIVQQIDPKNPEFSVAMENLKEHVTSIKSAIDQLKADSPIDTI